jgi:NAD(P)-dependent dehydrogenase (short-subunit alcohol dehydrogenase family)
MPRFEPHPQRRPAVVTGASSGIGEAAAEALAGAGYPVVLGARRLERCEETAAKLRAAGCEAHAFHLDLADPKSPARFGEQAVDALGDVEILVSNAALNPAGAVLDTDDGLFGQVLEVNVEGTHRLVRALLPAMVGRRRGDLVFVTSDVAVRPRPSMVAYVTSKWALEGYVRTLQMELEGTGVRATVLRPGPTQTAMGLDWDPDTTTAILEEWAGWGLARHASFMPPAGVARAVLAAVTMPRGTYVSTIELQPEAPIEEGS